MLTTTPKEEREVHFRIILMAMSSGVSYSGFQKLLEQLLKLHQEDPESTVNYINLNCWAINRTLRQLPRKLRIRIDKSHIVDHVEYAEVHKRIEAIQIVG